MLIEFSVENFKCFAEKQTLDMRPDPDITSLDENLIRTGLMDEADEELILLPSVAIYGANASGKSSLLKALFTIPECVDEQKDLLTNSPYETFFFNKNLGVIDLIQIAVTRNESFFANSVTVWGMRRIGGE